MMYDEEAASGSAIAVCGVSSRNTTSSSGACHVVLLLTTGSQSPVISPQKSFTLLYFTLQRV